MLLCYVSQNKLIYVKLTLFPIKLNSKIIIHYHKLFLTLILSKKGAMDF